MGRNDPMQLDPDLIDVGGAEAFIPFSDLDLTMRHRSRRFFLLDGWVHTRVAEGIRDLRLTLVRSLLSMTSHDLERQLWKPANFVFLYGC